MARHVSAPEESPQAPSDTEVAEVAEVEQRGRRPWPSLLRLRGTGAPLARAAKSPFVAPCLWITVSLSLYQLRWSELYAPLQLTLTIFLVAVVVSFAAFALRGDSGLVKSASWPTRRLPLIAITLYFVAAFAANGGIPVVMIALGQPYDIYGFGIPNLHVVMLAFTSYHALRYLRSALVSRRKWEFAAYFYILVVVGMMASRSALSFIVFASLIMLLRAFRLNAWRSLAGVAVLVGFLWGFGQFGNARLAYQVEQATGQVAREDVVLIYAQATPSFRDTGLDPAWMWSYLYLSSPLANLNAAFEDASGSACGETCDLDGLILYEMVPDVVGARVAAALDVAPFDKETFLVKADVNASTAFGSAVGYAGMLGAAMLATWMLLVVVASTRVLRESPLREEGLAILSTILFFSFFENMISYSPLSLQLVIVMVSATFISKAKHRAGRGSMPVAEGAAWWTRMQVWTRVNAGDNAGHDALASKAPTLDKSSSAPSLPGRTGGKVREGGSRAHATRSAAGRFLRGGRP